MAASCRDPKHQRDDEVAHAIKSHLQLLGYHSSIQDLKALHFLFCQLDSDAARLTFRTCWPAHDRKQDAEFRKLCRNWLQNIADNVPDAMIPKQVGSILMNPQSRKFQKLMFSMCRYVMSEILTREGAVAMQEYVDVTPSYSAIYCAALKIETAANLGEFKKDLVQINKCLQAQEYADAMMDEYNTLIGSSESLNRQAIELSQKHRSIKEYYDSWKKARASGDAVAMQTLKAEAIVQKHEPLSKICDILQAIDKLPGSPSPSIAAIASRSDDSVQLIAEPGVFKDATESIRQLKQHLSTVNFDIFKSTRTMTEVYCKDAEDNLKAVQEVNVKMGSEQIPDSRASIREMRSHRSPNPPDLVIDSPSPISDEEDEDEELRFGSRGRLDALHHTPVLGERLDFVKPTGNVTRCGLKSSSTPKRIPSPLLKDPFAGDFQQESEVELETVGGKQCTRRKKPTDESLMPKYLCGAAVNLTSTPFLNALKPRFSVLPRPMPQGSVRNVTLQEDVFVKPQEKKRPMTPKAPEFSPVVKTHQSRGFCIYERNVHSAAVDEVVNEVLGVRSSTVIEKIRSPLASPKLYQNGSHTSSVGLEREEDVVNLSEIVRLLDSPFKCPKERRRSRSAEPITTKSTDSPRIRHISDQDGQGLTLDTDLSHMLNHGDEDWPFAPDDIYCETDSLLLPSSPY